MAYRDSTIQSGFANTLTVDAPVGLAENDIVILEQAVGGYNNLTITWPAGITWTEIGNTSCDNSVAADNRTHRVVWARMGSSPPSSFTTSWSSVEACSLKCVAFSGRHLTNPPVAFQTQPIAASATRPFIMSATGGTILAGDDVATFYDVFGTGDAGTFTPPTDYTSREISAQIYAIGQLSTRDDAPAGLTDPIVSSWDSGFGNVSFGAVIVRIPAATAPAPVITSGTPTGTTTGNPTLGFSTTSTTGTARIVVDTASNLDTVTASQILLGQKEDGSAAAYDTGNITVTGNTVTSTAIAGLPSGTYTAAAAQTDGVNSNVLLWTFTVDSTPPAFTSGPSLANVTSNSYTIYGTSNENGTAKVVVGTVNSSQPSDAVFDALTPGVDPEAVNTTAGAQFQINYS